MSDSQVDALCLILMTIELDIVLSWNSRGEHIVAQPETDAKCGYMEETGCRMLKMTKRECECAHQRSVGVGCRLAVDSCQLTDLTRRVIIRSDCEKHWMWYGKDEFTEKSADTFSAGSLMA